MIASPPVLTLGIIIPTLDEEQALPRSLSSALATCQPERGDVVVVTDGGSRDRTRDIAQDIAQRHPVLWIEGPAGRGVQLNRGAHLAIANGATALLFLHADTTLPPGARERVCLALAEGAVGGGFLVHFDGRARLLRLGEMLVNFRTRWLKVPLGDQAQFARADAFASCGGYPEWPILEDVELLRRLRRYGRLRIIDAPATTDARRFAQRGVLRTVATNWLIWTLYGCGISPHRLGNLYRHVR
jgi:rSAM/selenodomain-associated transferase 2